MNLLISLLALCAWGLWGYTILFIDPDVPLAPLAFYGVLFVALTCTLSLALGGTPSGEGSRSNASSAPQLGHAAIVSTLLLFALWLQSLRMLTALNGTLLAAMLLLIELGFFLSGGRRRPKGRRRPRRPPAAQTDTASER